jgi:hypothetical protein
MKCQSPVEVGSGGHERHIVENVARNHQHGTGISGAKTALESNHRNKIRSRAHTTTSEQ